MTQSKTATKDIRIFLIDDHQAVRDGLRRILEQEEDMLVVGQGTNREDTIVQLENLIPDVVLMDIKMPGMDGIELTRIVKQRRPDCNVIMLTMYDEYLPQAMEAGAAGYFLKGIKFKELTRAIRRVNRGEVVIGDNVSERVRREYNASHGYSAGDANGDHVEVQLLIPSPVEASALMNLAAQIEERLKSRVLQVVGSWQEGTIITMVLGSPTPLSDIILTLSGMTGVASVTEVTPEDRVHADLLKRASLVPQVKNRSRSALLVRLTRGRTPTNN